MLTRQRHRLEFKWFVRDETVFTSDDGTHSFSMRTIDYEDMGCPTVITLTVEPGDLLNEVAD